MARFFALLDGTKILSVVGAADRPAEPHAELTGPIDWAQRPSRSHRAHWIGGAVVWQDQCTLEQAKADRIAVMREAREAAINSKFSWGGSEFDSDQISQIRLLGLFLQAQSPFFVAQPWRLANNQWRTLTSADAAGVWAALQAHLAGHFATFAAREAAINAATTVPGAKAINWA